LTLDSHGKHKITAISSPANLTLLRRARLILAPGARAPEVTVTIPITREADLQPPLQPRHGGELAVALGGLALGGAERIVLDWAARVHPGRKVHLIALRDHAQEWPVPAAVRLTRLHGRDVLQRLHQLGRHISAAAAAHRGARPVCLCHLLARAERDALAAGGVFAVPVLHNAREGWIEEPSALAGSPLAIAVSRACAEDLRRSGWRGGAISVIHHLPAPRRAEPGARGSFRRAWNLPAEAAVIGMIGGIKPQKDYPLALQLLRALLIRRDAYLVIVGGPIGRDGRAAWHEILDEIERLGLRRRVALPGFLPDAARCLPAFDAFLNTSRHEGLSIATLEALASGLAVVASRVGGQGEVEPERLTLLSRDAPCGAWVDALVSALSAVPDAQLPVRRPDGRHQHPPPKGPAPSSPPWPSFPSYRLWTLASLARPFRPSGRVLFVTANLNAGGAQRSLVNLARALAGRIRFEIAVAGSSTADAFWRDLRGARVAVHRSGAGRDPFDHAEALIERICSRRIGTVCFWNVDAKIKLLLVKTLAFSAVRFVDASPGPGSFAELQGAEPFARRICFDDKDYYARLDRLVLKYHGPCPPEAREKVTVIPNGVAPARPRRHTAAARIPSPPARHAAAASTASPLARHAAAASTASPLARLTAATGTASPLTRLVTAARTASPPARPVVTGRIAPTKPLLEIPPARLVVSGRIAPAKHLLEILAALRTVWAAAPETELHVFGAAEPRHHEYARAVLAAAGAEVDRRVFFHGADFAALSRLDRFDAAVVLGQDQGCPNSLLEALAAGLPVAANDDGGTRELVIHEETGLLIADRSPAALAAALLRILRDPDLARRLGCSGREHVRRSFSLAAMARAYARLFRDLTPPRPGLRAFLRGRLRVPPLHPVASTKEVAQCP
jgi:glycosyltransferase involved in cell wall biosynthesis